MKNYVLFLFVTIFGIAYSQNYSKVKIYADANGIAEMYRNGIAVDHGIRKEGTFIITDLSAADIQKVQQMGYAFDLLIEDVETFYANQNRGNTLQKNTNCSSSNPNTEQNDPVNFTVPTTYGGYLKYNELLAELDQMAALYPQLISVKSPISTFVTWENRPIYSVKISNNPTSNDGDPMVLYSSLHHAREPLSMMQLVYYMWYLLENYETDAEVKYLVDNTQMIFVPCVNPDGYVYNETTNPNGGGMHRKNRNPAIGSSNKGVDINRNYSYGWGTTGVSSNQNDDTYPGTSAFSEPETKAMRWLVQNMPIRAALNAHTYGDMLLFPFGTTANEYALHHDYFVALTDYMTQYNGYLAQKSSGLYPASGDSDDYMYEEDNGVLLKDTVFAMTPEIGGSFWPASSDILPVSREMLHTNLSLAHMVHKFYVVKDTDVDVVATLTGVFTHNALKLGRESGSAVVSIEPLENIVAVGGTFTHNLNPTQNANGTISFSLDPTIQNGELIKYVLTTSDGIWIQRDTVVKTFGVAEDLITLLTDDATNATNWTGNWNTTTADFYSPSKSFADSPFGNYANNTTRNYVLNNSIDLSDYTEAKVSFYAKWKIEADYDYCQFQISTDGGNTWVAQCGIFTSIATNTEGVQPVNEPKWDGFKTSWVLEEINLSEYLGQNINMRFQLKSDGGVAEDGFYFDDFKIQVKETSIVDPNVGIQNTAMDLISIFPNPNNGSFVVKGAEVGSVLELTDVRGTIIFSVAIHQDNQFIDVKNIQSGTYFVQIDGKSGMKRILVF